MKFSGDGYGKETKKKDLIVHWEITEPNDGGIQMCTCDVYDYWYWVTGDTFWNVKTSCTVLWTTLDKLDMLSHLRNLFMVNDMILSCDSRNIS